MLKVVFWASIGVLQRQVSYAYTLMVKCKKDITPLLTQWSYVFLALTHWYVQGEYQAADGLAPCISTVTINKHDIGRVRKVGFCFPW